jgi:glucokinase
MVIGVDLGGTNIRAGLITGSATTAIRQVNLNEKDSLEKTLAQLIDCIAPLVREGVQGIGIGVPSVVDIENGIVYDVVNIPSWKKVALKTILEAEFRMPVYINNDVNCFALGEHQHGYGKPFASFVALTLGTGIGAGIILNNQLYTGSNCGAGEIGYIPYLDKNFEFYTSSSFFESRLTTAFKAHEDAINGAQDAIDIYIEYGHHLGNIIKAVAYAYDPEAIIIGGSITKANALFQKSMYAALTDFLFPESIKKLKIIFTDNEHIQLLGAAALVKTS